MVRVGQEAQVRVARAHRGLEPLGNLPAILHEDGTQRAPRLLSPSPKASWLSPAPYPAPTSIWWPAPGSSTNSAAARHARPSLSLNRPPSVQATPSVSRPCSWSEPSPAGRPSPLAAGVAAARAARRRQLDAAVEGAERRGPGLKRERHVVVRARISGPAVSSTKALVAHEPAPLGQARGLLGFGGPGRLGLVADRRQAQRVEGVAVRQHRHVPARGLVAGADRAQRVRAGGSEGSTNRPWLSAWVTRLPPRMPLPKIETSAPATGTPRVLSTHPTSPPPSSARACGDVRGDRMVEATTAQPKPRQELNALYLQGVD